MARCERAVVKRVQKGRVVVQRELPKKIKYQESKVWKEDFWGIRSPSSSLENTFSSKKKKQRSVVPERSGTK